MHEVVIIDGEPILRWVEAKPETRSQTRGKWVLVGHKRDFNIEYYVELNRQHGVDVLPDENGSYYAYVLWE